MLTSLQTVRLMSGAQLGRLHVSAATPATQARKTRAVLQRLTRLGLLSRLERRIGGVRAGSDGMIYGLSGLGHAVLDLGQDTTRRHRRAREVAPAFQDHTLAVAETYVQLVERCRESQSELLEFTAEARRRFTGMAGELVTLKPDGFVRLEVGGYEITEVEQLALRRFQVGAQSGVSDESVDQLRPVLDPFEPVLHHRDQLVYTVHDEVSQATLDVRPHMLCRIEVRGVGRQSDHMQPVPRRDQLPHHRTDMRVQIIPDQHDRATQLLVRGIQQGGIVGLGETAALTLAAPVGQRAVDQPAALAGSHAHQPGDRDPA
jgi:hypothetical protein